jgi:hypothetical protein
MPLRAETLAYTMNDAHQSQKCVKQERFSKDTRTEVAYGLIQAMQKPAGND